MQVLVILAVHSASSATPSAPRWAWPAGAASPVNQGSAPISGRSEDGLVKLTVSSVRSMKLCGYARLRVCYEPLQAVHPARCPHSIDKLTWRGKGLQVHDLSCWYGPPALPGGSIHWGIGACRKHPLATFSGAPAGVGNPAWDWWFGVRASGMRSHDQAQAQPGCGRAKGLHHRRGDESVFRGLGRLLGR